MNNDRTELDWREFDRAMEALDKAWEDVLKVWQDYRTSLQEQATVIDRRQMLAEQAAKAVGHWHETSEEWKEC